jgi:hypothetical protein
LGNHLPDWINGFVMQDRFVLFVQNFESQRICQEDSPHYSRSLSHELGHIATYLNCHFVTHWFSEGVSEYIARYLFPEVEYQFSDSRPNASGLDYFLKKPDELLINLDSNKPLYNRLYSEAGEYIKCLLRGSGIQELFKELQAYRLQQPIEEYFLQRSCLA